jgi:hypothetical protein
MSDDLGPEYRVEYPINVVLTNAKFRCTNCKKWKPASHFGLRCMEDEIIRNQPQCKPCRSKHHLRRVK